MSTRFAAVRLVDPPPRRIKCGHDLSTPSRPPRSLLAGVRRARARWPRARGLRQLRQGRRRPVRRAPTGAPRRPSRPRPSRSSTPTSTRAPPAWKQLLALGARFPSWPKLVAEIDKAANDATDDGPTLAQLRSLARLRSSRSACSTCRPTAPIRRCSGFAEVRDKRAARGGDHEGQGHPLARHARRLRPLRQQGRRRRRDLGRHRADLELKGVTEAAIDRLGGTGDTPRRPEHLQGHAGEPAERQHRRRLRAGLRAAEARDPRPPEGSDRQDRQR